jgi:type I restriction enzyme S subunit
MKWTPTIWSRVATLHYGKALRGYSKVEGRVPVYASSGQVGWTDKSLCPGPAVIVGRKGTLGCHYSTIPVFVIDTAFFLEAIEPNTLEKKWAYYALRCVDFKKIDTGAALPSLSREQFYSLNVNVPPIETQRRIAAVLGAYDDLIEVNRRRVAVLEAMARGLFEEWFVRFRFPGHENHKIIDTPNGPLPEGWTWTALVEQVEHAIGGTWGQAESDAKADTAAYILRGTDFPHLRKGSFGGVPMRYIPKKALVSRLLRPNDIVVEVSGGSKDQPVGRALLTTKELIGRFTAPLAPASFCRLLRIDPVAGCPYVAYWHLDAMYRDGRIERYQKQSTGLRNFQFTVFLEQERTVIAEPAIRSAFAAFIGPIMSAMANLANQNSRLAASRDLLLPRLISGELSVAAAERQLEDAA